MPDSRFIHGLFLSCSFAQRTLAGHVRHSYPAFGPCSGTAAARLASASVCLRVGARQGSRNFRWAGLVCGVLATRKGAHFFRQRRASVGAGVPPESRETAMGQSLLWRPNGTMRLAWCYVDVDVKAKNTRPFSTGKGPTPSGRCRRENAARIMPIDVLLDR